MKSPDHDELFPLWIDECYRRKQSQISEALGFIDSNSYGGKMFHYELQWRASHSEVEAMICLLLSTERKDSEILVNWLSGMEELLLGLNCTPIYCFGVNDGFRLAKEVSI